jgi:DEAD/DEAH box helicase domain-containing protein
LDVIQTIEERLSYFGAKIAHIHRETSLDPDPGPEVSDLNVSPKIKAALERLGITRLFKYQAEALNLISSKRNVLIVSGTGTGKTEAFLIPLLELALKNAERSVLIYPTKALGRDQLARISRFTKELGLSVGVFDGDTKSEERRRLSEHPPEFLITTPDMLHVGLPLSERYRKLIREAQHFVFDEVHVYDGVLASHLRALSERIRSFDEAHMIGASATIGTTETTFYELFGTDGVILRGSPRRKGMAVHVLVNIGPASRWTIAAYLMATLISLGLRTIAFVDSQQMAEVVAKLLERFGVNVPVHRAGLRSEERIEIERGLKAGTLNGVVATPTLELGIDIGDLDAAIMVTNPPSFAKYLQRAGRVGRRDRVGYVFTLLGEDPIDSYFLRNPQAFFKRELLPPRVETSNEEVLRAHAAAYLAEKLRVSLSSIPPEWASAIRKLGDEGLARITDGTAFPTSATFGYVRTLKLRGTGPVVSLYHGDRKIGERELPVALYDVYPRAIYYSNKRTFVVKSLDLDKLRADLEFAGEVGYYTRPMYSLHLEEVHPIMERKTTEGLKITYAKVKVREEVNGFFKYSISGKSERPVEEELYDEPIVFSYWTKGIVTVFPYLEGFTEVDALEAYHATEHVLISAARVAAGAGQTDLMGISYPSGHVAIMDSTIGGSGVAKLLYERFEVARRVAIDILSKCTCEDGCPNCVYSPYCGSGNKYLSRKKSLKLLTSINGSNQDEEIWGNPVV